MASLAGRRKKGVTLETCGQYQGWPRSRGGIAGGTQAPVGRDPALTLANWKIEPRRGAKIDPARAFLRASPHPKTKVQRASAEMRKPPFDPQLSVDKGGAIGAADITDLAIGLSRKAAWQGQLRQLGHST